ncbi:hypothetical protein PR202_gb18495 [Eleusine coracana subsp. coracana]|uniref:Uncharacterized protein n=1 Tax=Eleusine coracana subsp. coracana TaxID=191504 RepID=A0AAV5F5S5_ELECO|nr:hypothetical protein PR202_gb18495 [Eleusine coracana subsp. coracana]
MAACSRGLAAPPFDLTAARGAASWPRRPARIRCRCGAEPLETRRRLARAAAAAPERTEEWRVDGNKPSAAAPARRRANLIAMPPVPFPSPRSRRLPKQQDFYPRCTPRGPAPQSRDTPPKRGGSLLSFCNFERDCLSTPENEMLTLVVPSVLFFFAKDMNAFFGICLIDTGIASEKEWGINLLDEAVKESGTNEDGSTWFRESGEDRGENGYRCRWARMGGQSHDGSTEWTETWWEKSDWTGYKELGAEKSGKNAEGDSWWEKWKEVMYQDEWRWEKYDAKGWTEKGWSRTWGEEHFGNGKVHKYGKSTTGESWDLVVDEETYYE